MAKKKTQAEKILKKLNISASALARELDLNHSTVSRWLYPKGNGGSTGGFIPYKYHMAIKRIGRKRKVKLEAADFVGV